MVMDTVLSQLLRLLHPFMPHITEELWERLGFAGANHAPGNFIMFAEFPDASSMPRDEAGAALQARVAAVYASAGAARNLRAEYRVPSSKKVDFILKPAVAWAPEEIPAFARLINAGEVTLQPAFEAPSGMPRALTPMGELYMPLDGLVDAAAEADRLKKEIARVENELALVRRKLANGNFVANAPAAVVQEHRERETGWQEKLAQLIRMRDAGG
jgi:valyl-tRNA synthetase